MVHCKGVHFQKFRSRPTIFCTRTPAVRYIFSMLLCIWVFFRSVSGGERERLRPNARHSRDAEAQQRRQDVCKPKQESIHGSNWDKAKGVWAKRDLPDDIPARLCKPYTGPSRKRRAERQRLHDRKPGMDGQMRGRLRDANGGYMGPPKVR